MKINRGWLARHHACATDRAGFTKLFGRDATVEVTPASLRIAIGAELDVAWFGYALLDKLYPRAADDRQWEEAMDALDSARHEGREVKHLMGLMRRYDKRFPPKAST